MDLLVDTCSLLKLWITCTKLLLEGSVVLNASESTDLSYLDSVISRHNISKIYVQAEPPEDLRNRILNEIKNKTPDILHAVMEHYQQLCYCTDVSMVHFSHLIR